MSGVALPVLSHWIIASTNVVDTKDLDKNLDLDWNGVVDTKVVDTKVAHASYVC